MTANEKIPWKRLSVEAAAIVGSILLAFAIDAWWAERLERITEREELSRLYDEFSSNRERLDRWVSVDGFMQRIRTSSLRVSEIMDAAMKGGSETVSCRMVVACDGRNSGARRWGGFERRRDEDRLQIAGLLFEGMEIEADTARLSFNFVES